MGIINWFINRRLKKLGLPTTKKANSEMADIALKSAFLEMKDTQRTADKILQAKIIRAESQKTLEKIQALDENNEEDYDDDEEDDDANDMKEISEILQMFKKNPEQAQADIFANNPVAANPAQTGILERLQGLSPKEQLAAFRMAKKVGFL